MFSSYIKKAIQEFSYRNFNSVVVFEKRELESFQINNPERPYFYESMYRTSTRDQSILQSVLDEYFVLPSELKRTFYKTWEEITNKTRTELLIDQIIHYWDFDVNSIPNDNVAKLPDEIQAFAKEIKVIKSLNLSDFIENFKDYLYMSTTVQKKDIELIKEFIKPLFEYTQEIIIVDVVESKELKNILYEVLDTVPQDTEEFMRYLVYRLTGETLLIKNYELIEKLKNSDRRLALDLLIKYTEKSEDAYVEFAKIFNRYKPFFLALKGSNSNINLNPVINKISKLSKKQHMPKITSDYMKITEGGYPISAVNQIVKDLDIVYLIKLYNAMSYRWYNPKVLVYQVRNGKVFIKENKRYNDNNYIYYCGEVWELLKNMISKRIQANIKELGISFKNNRDKVDLCLPTSGKQFVGNFPFYSSFYIDWDQENAYVGIYWKNTETSRVDLDLSLTNEKQKLGWNSDYRNGDAIYSGDITDAPNGAVEAFKINSGDNFYSVNVNEYSGPDKMDFKLFIGKDNFGRNDTRYGKEMFENTVIPFSTKLELESRQQNIGFVVDNSLVLCNLRVQGANVSDIQSEDVIDSYKKLIQSKLKLNNINVHSVLPQDTKYVLDFENPDKDLLMKLVK